MPPAILRSRISEGSPVPAGRHLGRAGRQFRPVLGQRHQGRAVPVRRQRHAPNSSASSCPEYTDEVWHGYLPDARPGTHLRLSRARAVRAARPAIASIPTSCCSTPTPRRMSASCDWDHATVRLHDRRRGRRPDASIERDSAPFMPKCRVIDPAFTWGRERPPARAVGPHHRLRNACARLHQAAPAVPENLRGTFAGLGRKEVVDYIRSLGVTSVELLPIHTFVNDSYLLDKGLTNYWGYNTIGFFAPDPRYSAVPDFVFAEFKEMVARLHDAGLEVILDVVYNHTAEGNERGPTLSFKGIDNASLLPAAARPAALLHQRHRHRQHAEPEPSARAADGHRQPALLGDRDARRRLPLRPRHHPGPRDRRLRRGGWLPATAAGRIRCCRR